MTFRKRIYLVKRPNYWSVFCFSSVRAIKNKIKKTLPFQDGVRFFLFFKMLPKVVGGFHFYKQNGLSYQIFYSCWRKSMQYPTHFLICPSLTPPPQQKIIQEPSHEILQWSDVIVTDFHSWSHKPIDRSLMQLRFL